MSDISSWPPPPNITNPLAAHDDFLAACVLNSSDKKPVSRLRMMQDLHKKQDGDFRQSRAVVNDYCDRHAILPSADRVELCVVSLTVLICLAVIFIVSVPSWLNEKEFPAVTPVALLYALLGLGMIMFCIVILFTVWYVKRLGRNAEQARQKLAAQANTQI